WCDGRSDRIREPAAYAEARDVARQALNHQLEDVTDGALYFHARYATPYWAKRFVRTARIGQHLFYRN
ncbi:cell wall hydrolase, partial [uncultured Cobetia sp.]